MERVYERCCALDVHKEQVTACVHVPNQAGERPELCADRVRQLIWVIGTW